MKEKETISCTPRSTKIQPFYVMELLEKARALEAKGEDIVHMEIGEPDFPTPLTIRDAAVRAIDEGKTFYTHSLGLPALRQRIADYYLQSRGVRVSPERVVVTNGTSGAFLLLCAVLLDGNRNLVISDPGYPCYRNFGTLFDARVVSVPVSEACHFEMSPEQIDATGSKPDLVIISTPSNPTGTVYREESVARLHEFVRANGGVLVADEIYLGLTYGKRFPTSLALADDIVVVDGLSKTHAMTGWRVGWAIVPQSLVRPMQRVAQNVFISVPTVAQYAALRAFDAGSDLEAMRLTYQQRRDFLFPRLREIGFGLPAWPDGAFYVYAGIEKWGMDSMQFVERALLEAKVAITPGYDFGVHRAGSHVRFSYANSLEILRLGCDRLEDWLRSL